MIRRFGFIALLAGLLASGALPPSRAVLANPSLVPGLGYTTARLNLRIGPGEQHRVLTILPYHAVLTVRAGPQNGYYRVAFKSLVGWASGEFLDSATRAVTTDRLNLRAHPALDAPVVTVLPLGDMVRITGRSVNGFSPVRYLDFRGWSFTDYLWPLFAPVRGRPALKFPWPGGQTVWLTSGPHNGRYPIGSPNAPVSTRNALDFGRGRQTWAVHAAAPGTLVRAGCYLPTSEGLGCMVEIDHGSGWQTLYGHLRRDPRLDVGLTIGQRIPHGRLIGWAGATGRAYGVHLHFEVRHGGRYAGEQEWKQGRREGLDGWAIDGWVIRARPSNYDGFLTRAGYPTRESSDCRWTPHSSCPRNDLVSTNK